MLGKMKNQQTAGWYAVSYQMFFMLATLSGSFLTAVFPVMSRLFKESTDNLQKVYQKSFKLLISAGIPLSVGGIILARSIILFLYGSKYENSILPFSIFSSIFVFSYINGLAAYLLTAMNRQLSIAKMLTITTIVNIILNYALIPRFGTSGAAAATVVSEIMFSILFLCALPRELRYFPIKNIFKTIAAAAVMAAVILTLRNALNVLIVVAAGAAFYCVSIWLLRYFDKEDILIMKNVFGKA